VVYEHDISACLKETIGEAGLTPEQLAEALARTRPAFDWLRARYHADDLPMLSIAGRRDDLAMLSALVDKASRTFTDLVVLGTGGSSLGGQALTALKTHPVPPAGRAWLHFVDNIDAHDFGVLIDGLDFSHTLFLVISKSGGTAETLTQFLIAYDAVTGAVGEEAARSCFITVTQPGDSALRRLAERWQLPVLDHDPDLGGRYSALSLVGMIPALFAGVDGAKVRDGAAEVLRDTIAAEDPAESPAAVGAALAFALAEKHGIANSVLMPYCDRLAPFADWYCQLWAESLGKDGKGTTPIAARGAVDQHSQLQLYLDGPADKLITLITLDVEGSGRRVEPALIADEPDLAYLSGRTIGDLCDAEQRATADTLTARGRPVRIIRLEKLDEKAIGALMMHFMLETVIAGDLFDVDPFDQPAVEQGKVRARHYLAGEGAS
jgi:glucose-6-phosphate isomerase